MSRIISYGEKTEYNDGDYLLLDNGKGGTKRIRADRVGIQLDPTLTDPNKAAPANAVKPVDAVPAQGSSNAVSSGGVWDALHNTDTTLSQSVGAYPVDTAIGAIASFSDGADNIPMKSVKVAIEPVQDLHGQEAPWPAGGGKNLLPCILESGSQNGFKWVVGSDGVIVISGSSSSGVVEKVIGSLTLESGTYCMNGGTYPSNDIRIQLKPTSGGSTIATSYNNNDAAFTVEETTSYIVSMVIAPTTISGTTTIKPMVRLSSVTDATYAPYSNICPISGWTGAQVVRTGKNLFNGTFVNLAIASMNIVKLVEDSTCRGMYSRVVGGNTYTISRKLIETNRFRICATIEEPANNIGAVNISNVTTNDSLYSITVTVPEGYNYLFVYLSNQAETCTADNYQLELGSTATAYEPCTSNTYPITFPSEAGTVYGGELDVTNGTLTVDRGYYVVTNATEIINDGSYTDFNRVNIVDGTGKLSGKPNGGIISNVFKLGLLDVNSVFMHGTTGVINFTPSISIGTTLSEIKAWLIANNAEFCYELAEPITYTLTPTEIKSLLGDNNIWADAGDTTAVYRADTTLYINRKIAEAVSALS